MRKILQTVAVGALLALQVPLAGAETIYGLTRNNKMILIADLNDAGRIKGPYAVEGLAAGETLMAIDGNPANGAIYGLGYRGTSNTAQLYLINTSGTAYTASPIGNTFNLPLGTTPGNLGFNFDASSVYKIVITTSTGRRYTVNSSNGAMINSDQLAFGDNDINQSGKMDVAATTYINNFFGSDNTQMYGYDRASNSFVAFNNAGGHVATVGNIGGAIAGTRGISIESVFNKTDRSNGIYMVASPENTAGSHIYNVDLTTGNTTDIGAIGTGTEDLRDIAVRIDNEIPTNVDGNMGVALTANHRNLIHFDTKRPDVVRRVTWIHGTTAGQSIMAIDFRPKDMALYGLGYNPQNGQAQLYNIDMMTGNAYAVSSTPMELALGNSNTAITGFDFDPIGDYVRVSGSNGINVRISPVSGQVVTTDKSYTYAETDAFFGTASNLGAIAYTNNYYGAHNSQLIGIDYGTGALVSFNKPSTGIMNSVLNINKIIGTGEYANGQVDIYYDAETKQDLGYITANTYLNGDPYAQIYTLNPMTGETEYIGLIGTGISVRDIAIKPKYSELEVATLVQNHQHDLLLYPNPAVNQTRVVLPTVAVQPIHAYVTDMQGAVINHFVYAPGGNEIDIDVTSLRSGLYSIRVQEEGNTVRVARFSKQ
ncbi:MAG: DUF4394 domain-containing protein [Sphingobacteriales bacterium]|nr:MAG: DUF4394 domain-containing protein [Sphingobacteriales bacterium]